MTWSLRPSGVTQDLFGISFADATTAMAVGSENTIIRSTNGGLAWVVDKISTPVGVVLTFSGIGFDASGVGIVVGKKDTTLPYPVSIVMRSTDKGANWTRISNVQGGWLRAVRFNSVGRAIVVGDSGTIFRSTTAGLTWARISSGAGTNLFGVAFSTPEIGVIVGDKGTILRTTDGGQTWNSRLSVTSNRLYGVSFATSNIGYAVGDSMTVLQTLDGGLTWEYNSGGSNSTLFAVSFLDADHGTIVGEGGAILSSSTPGTPVSVKDHVTEPTYTFLSANYPNPFNATTVIRYQLSESCSVNLRIFDVLGREIVALVDEPRGPGTYTLQWNAAASPSGVYFCRLQASRVVETRKLVLIR
jgi:photosystem II stability/assembly factor-like uncharacterized protein